MDARVAGLREEFPILQRQVNGHPLIYLDNAATMQMPKPVIDRLVSYRCESHSNVHRGIHTLSENATEAYEAGRAAIARFIGAAPGELILTAGTTDSINRFALMMLPRLTPASRIVVTRMEHHSNLLVWRNIANSVGCGLTVVPVDSNGVLDQGAFADALDVDTAIVSFTQLSNVSGIANDCSRLCRFVHERTNAVCMVDGAQGVAHLPTNVHDMGCDAYAFSGHKVGGPCGTGGLFISESLMVALGPATFGGGTVYEVDDDGVRFYDTVERFEPGTPNIPGVIGLAETLGFWNRFGRAKLLSYENELVASFTEGVSRVEELTLVGRIDMRAGCVSVVPRCGAAFDWAKMLDCCGIAARSGHHCAQPYLRALGFRDSLRFSFAPYNTEEEVLKTLDCLTRVARTFKKFA